MKRQSERYVNDPTPSEEAVAEYRARFDTDEDASLALVTYRGGPTEFALGETYSRSADPLDRRVGARILAELGWSDQTFHEESVAILIEMLSDPDPSVIASAACAQGKRRNPKAIPHLLLHLNHPDDAVRNGISFGLQCHEDPAAIAGLIQLSVDPANDVRDWAVLGLGSMCETDTPELREALWKAVSDPLQEIRGEALVGLARRKDPSTQAAILKEWEQDDIGFLSIEAAMELADPVLLPQLLEFQDTMDFTNAPHFEEQVKAAITACAQV